MAGASGGVLEGAGWPTALSAHVVTVGRQPQIHGYDVEADLARHYRFTDTVLLALTGELPTESSSLAFDVVLQFLAPATVAEAPTHAAVLARLSAAATAGVVSTGAIVLAQQAHHVLVEHEAFMTWLDRQDHELPDPYRAADRDEAASVQRLREALAPTRIEVRGLGEDLSLESARLAVLHACGLTTAAAMEVALVLARIPCLVAEAMSNTPGSFRDYPVNLPPFHYEPGR
jgi:hypothetical protein